MDYDFRDVSAKDLKLIGTWLSQPHVSAWWGDAAEEFASIKANLDSDSVEHLIVELDGKPIGFLQSYDPHMEDEHPYKDQPMGTLGLDMFIGDAGLLQQGHGTGVLNAFVELLFEEGVPRVIVDPSPKNFNAIRAYEKAGFAVFDTRESDYGPALMMARDNDMAFDD